MPISCPKFCTDDEQCKISYHHHRERLTGPCFPLVVVQCKTHKKGFTLYCQGQVPYGRVPLVSMTPDGYLIADQNEHDLPYFTGTLFQAAIDASKQQCWAHESIIGEVGRYETQISRLARDSCVVGVDDDTSDNIRGAISRILEVPHQYLLDEVDLIKNYPGYVSCGQAICSILIKTPFNQSLFERLIECGYQNDLWPQPFLCETQIMNPTQFHVHNTRAPP